MISTATQARDIVRLSKFPPVGIRGQGGPFACFAHGLGTPKEYVEQANERVMVIMQIETAEGVENIDEICSVDGVCTSIPLSLILRRDS
jgi:4-hydroxy-2-oxoheptanedioate aldolase